MPLKAKKIQEENKLNTYSGIRRLKALTNKTHNTCWLSTALSSSPRQTAQSGHVPPMSEVLLLPRQGSQELLIPWPVEPHLWICSPCLFLPSGAHVSLQPPQHPQATAHALEALPLICVHLNTAGCLWQLPILLLEAAAHLYPPSCLHNTRDCTDHSYSGEKPLSIHVPRNNNRRNSTSLVPLLSSIPGLHLKFLSTGLFGTQTHSHALPALLLS